MRSRLIAPSLVLAAAAALACGKGGGEQAPAADSTAQEEAVMSVPDSTIVRNLQASLSSDPRLSKEGVDIAVHADGGNVTLVGSVPTRYEMAIAREVALSSPGVRNVYLDSLKVLSEAAPPESSKART